MATTPDTTKIVNPIGAKPKYTSPNCKKVRQISTSLLDQWIEIL